MGNDMDGIDSSQHDWSASGMAMDDSASPAASALVRLQELPPCKVDESGRPYLLMDDLDDRERRESATSLPILLRENAPPAG